MPVRYPEDCVDRSPGCSNRSTSKSGKTTEVAPLPPARLMSKPRCKQSGTSPLRDKVNTCERIPIAPPNVVSEIRSPTAIRELESARRSLRCKVASGLREMTLALGPSNWKSANSVTTDPVVSRRNNRTTSPDVMPLAPIIKFRCTNLSVQETALAVAFGVIAIIPSAIARVSLISPGIGRSSRLIVPAPPVRETIVKFSHLKRKN